MINQKFNKSDSQGEVGVTYLIYVVMYPT